MTKEKKMFIKILIAFGFVLLALMPIIFSRILTPLPSKNNIEKYATEKYGTAVVNEMIKSRDKRVYKLTDKEGMFDYELTAYRTNVTEKGSSVFWSVYKEDTFHEEYAQYITKEVLKKYPVKFEEGQIVLKLAQHDNITAANVSSEITKLDTREYFKNLEIFLKNEEGKILGIYIREEKQYFTLDEYEEHSMKIHFMDIVKDTTGKDPTYIKRETKLLKEIPGLDKYEYSSNGKTNVLVYYYELEGKQYYIADLKVKVGNKMENFNSYKH